MAFKLPTLPYAPDALAPTISAETIGLHHGKHHASYVKKLNELVVGTEWADKTLDEIVAKAPRGAIFDNAAQHWNHSFYWRSMRPDGGGKPTGDLAAAVKAAFGSPAAMVKQLATEATSHFGSGWAWLASDKKGALSVLSTHDADLPQRSKLTPLLTIDVWEHAYYVDYRNARPDYVRAFFARLVNWEFAAANYGAVTK